MTNTSAHREVARKLIFNDVWDQIPITDSLMALIEYLFNDDEAEVVAALGFMSVPARMVAGRVGRPVAEVEPILRSLSERFLIAGMTVKGVQVYGLLPIWPGIFEVLMLHYRNEQKDEEYYRRFSELFEDVYAEYFTWVKPLLEKKDVRIMRIIPIGQSLEYAQGVMPLATDKYFEIIDRNTSFALASTCACRQEYVLLGKGCGKPLGVCGAMGILADLGVEKGLARRVSKEEFLEVKAEAFAAGLVNLTDNLHDPLQVCSCCGCCCGVLRLLKNHQIPTLLAKSHFEAKIDTQGCTACGSCVEVCPMQAVTIVESKAKIDYARCIGCGLCVTRCDEKAVSLVERAGHIPPSANPLTYYSDRCQELLGKEALGLKPRLAMGFGRLLGTDSRISLSGPRYKPKV